MKMCSERRLVRPGVGLASRPFRAWGSGRTRKGRPGASYGLRARWCSWPPLRLARVRRERESVGVVRPPPPLRCRCLEGGGVRSIGLDVHRDFCEVTKVSDLFGAKRRVWLKTVRLVDDEQLTLDGALR